MDKWRGPQAIPGSDSGGFGEHVIAAIRDFAELGNRLSQVTFLHGVPHRSPMQNAGAQLILTLKRALLSGAGGTRTRDRRIMSPLL
jgi:hypothetical protein